MWIPKGAAHIRARPLFEPRNLLEEIRHVDFYGIFLRKLYQV